MALASEHDLRVLDQTARDGGQSLEPVLADADDGQPAAGCGRLARKGVTRRHATHPHPRRHDGGATAGGTPRPSRRPGRHASRSQAAPPRRRDKPCRCGPAGSAAPRGLPTISRPNASTSSSTPPTHTPPTSRRTPPRRQRSRACRCWRLRRPPWVPRAGDNWTEVADPDAAVQALGPSPRRVFLALGRSEIGAFAASAAALLSGAQRRSGRSAARGAARGLCDRSRTVHRSG